MRLLLLVGAASLGILFVGCGNGDDDISYSLPDGFATLTIANEGVTVEPELVDDTGLWLTMVNESDEVTSVSIRFHGQDVEPLEFGLAPGEERLEILDAFDDGGLRLEWEDETLHVYQRELSPTPTPFWYAAQTSGCVHGYRDHLRFDADAGDILDFAFLTYVQRYASGYLEGYTDGLLRGHGGSPEIDPEEIDPGDLVRDELFYVRGYGDGHADGYLAATDPEFSQTYRDEYFEGFYFGLLGDEEEQCESLEATPGS